MEGNQPFQIRPPSTSEESVRVIKGTHRIVLVFERFGFVLKFPYIHWHYTLDCVVAFIQDRGRGDVPNLWLTPGGALYEPITQGFTENWCEYRFYQNSPYPFLLPTYFSLFGMMNVQRMGLPCELYGEQNLYVFRSVIPSRDLVEDLHHFLNARDNFCRDPDTGEFMMLDYGSAKTQCILRKHADRLLLLLLDALEKAGYSFWEGRS